MTLSTKSGDTERAEPASHLGAWSGSERHGKGFWSKLSEARGSRAWLRLWWFGHQRLQGLHQFRQPVLLGDDRIEPSSWRHLVSQIERQSA